ncbi:16S rRNA (guanine(966)-N(2))-methyltransferase (EC [Olavius algarvensis associated proteobacterium Delta 3]|nr:16S rRNA (guanine(966)-N(2))-methyltransferase (EC [Olavius algarvensis associated proteobacterium Delta 3]
MRVIAGSLKGRKLAPVKGMGIRPTSDRLRESIFSILSHCVQGAVVLDLFAGTGALGIESLSRGAKTACFIDHDPRAVAMVRQNVDICRIMDRVSIIQWNVVRNLNCLHSFPSRFDLVFIDPPYRQNAILPTLSNLCRSGRLEHDACLVLEHSMAESLPPIDPPLVIRDQRKYGKTLVSFLAYMVQK